MLPAALSERSGRAEVTYELREATSEELLERDRAPVGQSLEQRIFDHIVANVDVQRSPPSFPVVDDGVRHPAALDAFVRGLGHAASSSDPGNLDRAIDAFKKALNLHPAFPEAHAELGLTYLEKHARTNGPDLPKLARAECDAANQEGPAIAPSHVCRSRLAGIEGDNVAALAEAQIAVNIDPLYPAAYRHLARAHRNLGNDEAAESTYFLRINQGALEWMDHSWLAEFYNGTEPLGGGRQSI